MCTLSLSDLGTREVIRQYDLKKSTLLGRGQFAVVHETDKDDEVLKLTADSVHVEGFNIFLKGEHFPELTENHGIVGEQYMGNYPLYLFKMERLRLLKEADRATKKLAGLLVNMRYARMDAIKAAQSQRLRQMSWQTGFVEISRETAKHMAESLALPLSIRNAMETIYMMSCNYINVGLDLQLKNFMVHPDGRLMFSDPVCDVSLL